MTMPKAEVIRVLGAPDAIYFGDARFSLRDSPTVAHYVFARAGLSILFQWDTIQYVAVLSELYEYPGGIRVGMNVAGAEEVLGKIREDTASGSASGSIEGHQVYFSGETPYRLADFPRESLTLRVNVDNGIIEDMRVWGSHGILALATSTGEQTSREDSIQYRSWDLRRFSGTGILLDRYVLVTSRSDFRTADKGDPFTSPPFSTRFWVLRSSSESQCRAQAASFIDAIDSLGSSGPPVEDIVSRFGPPTAILLGMDRLGDDAISYLLYGQLLLEMDRNRLARVGLSGPDGQYRYRGKIGIGSTAEEVYAELGEPVQTAPEGLAGVGPDQVLFVQRQDGHEYGTILYENAGLEFSLDDGTVSSFARVWK